MAIVVASVATVLLLHDDKPSPDRAQPSKHRTKPRPTISLAWVGDISLSTAYGLPADPDRTLLAGVKRRLARSTITVGNLEGTLGSGGSSKCAEDTKDCFAFQAPPSYAGVLKRAGFDVLNVANNHALDYGASGQRQTIAALERQRLRHTGRPGEILVRRVGAVKVAFVGFAPYAWAAELRDIDGARQLVARARRRADVVVAIIHAGAEGSDKAHTPSGTEIAFGENRGNTREFAHAVVRAGADLVLGSGPHVVRGVELYRGRLIAYSLGNFLGYHTFSTGGTLSLSGILQVRLDSSGRPLGGRWTSVRLGGAGVPEIDHDDESARFVRGLSAQDFGRGAYPMSADGRLRAGSGG